jgi:hypothetical protein
MKRTIQTINYQRLAKAIENVLDKKENLKGKEKNRNGTLNISLLALAISLLTLYFQFFYEKYHLIASVVDGTLENDSLLVLKIIYHNKGNQHSTVTQNAIYFYQDSTDIENKGFHFSSIKSGITYKDEYVPLVLTPGQQIYRDISQPISFKGLNYELLNIDPTKDIKIAIKIGFINENGFHSANIIPIGWLKLNKIFVVNYWNIEFTTSDLESNAYYSRRYVKPK